MSELLIARFYSRVWPVRTWCGCIAAGLLAGNALRRVMGLPNSSLKRLPPRAPPTAGPPVLRPDGPPIGRTFVAVVVLAVGLSLLPLPEALRPFPSLREAPGETVAALLWPRRAAPPVAQPPPPVLEAIEVAEGEADDDDDPQGMVFEPLDLTVGLAEPRRARSVEARRWDVLLSRLQAGQAQVVDPCRDARCSATALSPWFAALEALPAAEAPPARVVTIGTSLIASDHITDVLRRRLQRRYGEGGPGFLFVDRPTRNAGRAVRSGAATEGWVIEKVTDKVPLALGGLGGVAFTAGAAAPQSTTYPVAGARRLELFAVAQAHPGAVQVLGDARLLAELELRGEAGRPLFEQLALPEGLSEVTLRTRGAVRLDGVVLERAAPGVVLDSLGLPGASATVLLAEDEALFAAQLQARQPALVILMVGGNDAFDLSLNRYPVDTARQRMAEVVRRVRAAVPGAACLLASPPDAGLWRMDQTLSARTQTRVVASYMRELAQEHGCAWYDMQAAMGGEGAIERWWAAGLMNRDLVHPLALGGDLLGYQLDQALEQAHREHPARTRAVGSLNGGRRALGPGRPQVRPPPRGRVGASPAAQAWARRHGRTSARDVDRAPSSQADGGTASLAPGLQCEPDGGTPSPDAGLAGPAYLLHPEALGRVFTRLRALEEAGTGRVAIMQLGASHTAAHVFTDEARALLAARFGSAGRGFVAAGKPSPRLERARVGRALFGHWSITDALQLRASSLVWGLTGVRAEAAPGASMTISFDEAQGTSEDTARLQLYYLEEAGRLPPEVMIDGELVDIPAETAKATGVRVIDFVAPGQRHVVSVSNPGPGPMSFFGVSEELVKPGIVYDALGLPGSTAITLASYDQRALKEQVRARQPDLFVLFFGTNESGLAASRVAEMKASYPLLFSTLREAAPEADCLILGPTDRMRRRPGGWREAESLEAVTRAMEEVALEQGCAFWRTRAAMGGPGAIERWRRQKLAKDDHVHLTTEGYQRLSRSFIDELLRAYDGWGQPP